MKGGVANALVFVEISKTKYRIALSFAWGKS
jgi:hypothetical protein